MTTRVDRCRSAPTIAVAALLATALTASACAPLAPFGTAVGAASVAGGVYFFLQDDGPCDEAHLCGLSFGAGLVLFVFGLAVGIPSAIAFHHQLEE